MVLRKGLPAKLAATDADDTRYVLSGLVTCNANGTPRAGVLAPLAANIVTGTGTMNVSVARFQAVAVRDSGVVLLANDGPANVLLDAAPVANSRIDVIYAKQNDASGTVVVPDANNLPVLAAVKGTAAAVPVKPAVPAGALELATVFIPASATSTSSGGVVITQTAALTVAAGGVLSFRNKTEMDAVTSLDKGSRAVLLSNLNEYQFDGSVWVSTKVYDSGWVTPTLAAGWSTPAGNYADLQYRRIDSLVMFRGACQGASTADPLFTLPADCRPPTAGKDIYMAVMSGASTPPTLVRVVIRSNGTINVQGGTTPNFDLISFRNG